jgi:pyridoxamine 5'-phosphate oxidase
MENLTKYNLSTDPFETFNTWFTKAKEIDDNAEAFALATSTSEGMPSVRYILFKGLLDNQFKFFTNYNSDKAQDLDSNPFASMAFFWRNSGRQVRITGKIVKADTDISMNYFSSRDKESQVASAVSNQSSPIESREKLLENYNNYLSELSDGEVPYPDNWGGYLLQPTKIEFFIYGEHRLNDRFEFILGDDNSWQIQRLQP